MTLVSIITPSFNQAAYLEETMRSVLDQEDARLEYIVVDGGSEDGSLDIIRKHADRLAYWMSEKDAGQAEAINKGMARARGEIVAWLNSDDYYLPGVIEQARKAFELHPEALLIYGDMRAVDEDGRVSNEFKYPQLRLEDLLCFQIIGQPSVFMRRAAFQKVGGLDPTFHYLLDHHLWIRIAQLGPIVHVDQTWSVARYHAAAKNRARAREFGREAFRILDQAANVPALAPVLTRLFRRAHASAHRVDARYLLDGGKPARAIAAWTRAFMLHPPTALARLNILGSALIN
ncbi:MAG TPA: glycosyltransferase family 2 protein, partial [Anaerolineales bacterium]